MTIIQARVGLQQRVVPEYRAPFFEMLGTSCLQGLSVFAGSPREDEAINTIAKLKTVNIEASKNIHISRGRTYFCLQPGILRWLENWQPNLLIVEANVRYLSTPSAVNWMHHRHRPVIGWGLGVPNTTGAESTLRRNFLKSLDALIAYSKSGAQQYIAEGIDPKRVFVAPNAVAARPVNPAPFRSNEYQNGSPNLLFVGRLQERKHLDVLLQACADLPKDLRPNLTIIGDGPDRSRLETLAQKLYPSAQFTGTKLGAELDLFYRKADLFVLPGTGGLAVQQAMAHALPVIVGEADGTQSELVRPENGWLLPSADSGALSSSIAEALKDVKRLREKGAASYRIVAEEVNLEIMVEMFAKAIKSVL